MQNLQKNYHEETGLLESEGLLVDGKRQGLWKFYYPSGELEKEGYYLDDKAQGDYTWYKANGKLSTTGGFVHGQRHGHWIWRDEQEQITHELDYQEGIMQGQDIYRFADTGQIRLQRQYDKGELTGPIQVFDKQGQVLEEGFLRQGLKDGDYYTWEKGKKKKTIYTRGIKKLTEKQWQSLVNNMAKKTGAYAKISLFEKYCEYNARPRMLWILFEEKRIAVNKHQELFFGELAYIGEESKARCFVELLKELEPPFLNYSGIVQYWPHHIDQLTMRYYLLAPSAFEKLEEQLDPALRLGYAMCLRRLGQEIPCPGAAQALAKEHIQGNGIGILGASKDGYSNKVWFCEEGKVLQLNINDPEVAGKPNADFYRFIELFCSREEWEEAVLEQALQKKNNLSLPRADAAFLRAQNQEQVLQLYQSLNTDYTMCYRALLELRTKDSVEDLLSFLQVLAKERTTSMRLEITALAAVLRAKARGQEAPEQADEYIQLSGYASLIASGKSDFEGLPQLKEALSYLPNMRRNAIFQRVLEDQYQWKRIFPLLADYPEWQERAIDSCFERFEAELQLSNAQHLSEGIGSWGIGFLPQLPALLQRAKEQKALGELLAIAAIKLLAQIAKQGQSWEEGFDKILQLYVHQSRYNDEFDNYVQADFYLALNALPQARKEQLLYSYIDAESPLFMRFFSLLDTQSPRALIEASFKVLKDYKNKRQGTNWFEKFLTLFGHDARVELFRLALQLEIRSEYIQQFTYIVGQDIYTEILASQEQGKTKVMEKHEQLQEACKDYFQAHPQAERTKIYYLRQNSEAPSGLCQSFGAPRGVDADTRPKYKEEYMTQVLFLDLSALPLLAAKFPESIKALALYVYEPDNNKAYSPYSAHAALALLGEEDLKKPQMPEEEDEQVFAPGQGIEAIELEVPSVLFDSQEEDLADDIKDIRSKLYSAPGYLLGQPIWLQDAEHNGFLFIGQFDERISPLNLGDSGIMYMYHDTAFWQCH